MDKRILGVFVGVIVIITSISVAFILQNPEINANQQQQHEKIGLVVNLPNQSATLKQLDEIYSQASSTGIGRSNVYLFWNLVEPVRGEYDWKQSDALMSFNKNNNLKVTLYFSVINGETLGPFPSWIGKTPLVNLGDTRVVSVLDAILSRYDIIDTVILSGDTESQFRFNEQNIPVYKDLFADIYDQIKQKHPDVKLGNSFALHNVLNKDLQHIVTELTIGDFVAFSYFPTDILNDIVKTPQQAKDDLQQIFSLVSDKNIGIFELSWSTSDFVGGNTFAQREFLEKSFEFYTENESELEFFTWYRQYDKPKGTCIVIDQEVGEDKLKVGGSGFGDSAHVAERLSNYVCSAGLISSDGTPKSGWNEFKEQIKMIN